MAEFKILRHYMVDIDLPSVYDPYFISLIPGQRDRVNQLMQQGVILSYALSVDRSKLWIVMLGSSTEDVSRFLESFPLFPYMQINVSELVFFNNAVHRMPELSLNWFKRIHIS